MPWVITPGSQTYLSSYLVLISLALQDHFLTLALLILSHLKLQLGRMTFQACSHCQLKQLQDKDLKFICKSVRSPSEIPGLTAAPAEFALGSADNVLCCPLVAGHEARFVAFSQIIFCHLWYYWLKVQS